MLGAHRALREFEERVERRRREREEERAREERAIEDERKELLARAKGVRGLSVSGKRGWEGACEERKEGERKARRVDGAAPQWTADVQQPERGYSTQRGETTALNRMVTEHGGDAPSRREAPAQEFAQEANAPREGIELARPADTLAEYYTEAQMREGSGLFVTPARSPSPGPFDTDIPDGKFQPSFSQPCQSRFLWSRPRLHTEVYTDLAGNIRRAVLCRQMQVPAHSAVHRKGKYPSPAALLPSPSVLSGVKGHSALTRIRV